MHKEIKALQDNGTWETCTLPVGKKALGNKWVYKIKLHADGTIERLKGRLVILGNHQKYRVDYFETFSPVIKMPTIRSILSLAATKQ